jgi:hypothetical protein
VGQKYVVQLPLYLNNFHMIKILLGQKSSSIMAIFGYLMHQTNWHCACKTLTSNRSSSRALASNISSTNFCLHIKLDFRFLKTTFCFNLPTKLLSGFFQLESYKILSSITSGFGIAVPILTSKNRVFLNIATCHLASTFGMSHVASQLSVSFLRCSSSRFN